MPDLITSDGNIRQDNWAVVPRPADGDSLDIPDQPSLIPADLWLAGKKTHPRSERQPRRPPKAAVANETVNTNATQGQPGTRLQKRRPQHPELVRSLNRKEQPGEGRRNRRQTQSAREPCRRTPDEHQVNDV